MSWILLDTFSVTNLVRNPSLLHNIHTVDHSIGICCNTGTTSMNQMGYLGGYPTPVWYNPEGIDNILSLKRVSWYYQLTMDTCEAISITMHCLGNTPTLFTPSCKRLYQYDMKSSKGRQDIWALVASMKDQSTSYNKGAYK